MDRYTSSHLSPRWVFPSTDFSWVGAVLIHQKRSEEHGISIVNVQGTSLVIQPLRLSASTAGGAGSIPGQGTKSHMPHGMAKTFLKMKKWTNTESVGNEPQSLSSQIYLPSDSVTISARCCLFGEQSLKELLLNYTEIFPRVMDPYSPNIHVTNSRLGRDFPTPHQQKSTLKRFVTD